MHGSIFPNFPKDFHHKTKRFSESFYSLLSFLIWIIPTTFFLWLLFIFRAEYFVRIIFIYLHKVLVFMDLPEKRKKFFFQNAFRKRSRENRKDFPRQFWLSWQNCLLKKGKEKKENRVLVRANSKSNFSRSNRWNIWQSFRSLRMNRTEEYSWEKKKRSLWGCYDMDGFVTFLRVKIFCSFFYWDFFAIRNLGVTI